jgi:hypothetical protein
MFLFPEVMKRAMDKMMTNMRRFSFILIAITIAALTLSCQKAEEPKEKKSPQVEKQAIAPSDPEAVVKPELIWQKDFGTKVLRFMLHKEVGSDEFPIMAVELENELIVFDKKRNEITRRSIPILEVKGEKIRGYVVISDNGKYILEGKGIPQYSYDLKYTTVNGKFLWEKKDFSGEPVVSPDGNTIILLNLKGNAKKGKIEFYNSAGKVLKQHSMDISSVLMPLYKLAFSENGNYFVLRLEQWIEEEGSRKAIYPVILFDNKGNLLWQQTVEVTGRVTPYFELLISPLGNTIAYSGNKYIYVVNKQGDLLWKSDFRNLYSFSSDGDYLLMSNDEGFIIVDAKSGKEILSRTHGYPQLSSDGRILAVIEKIKEFNGEELILNILDMGDKKERLIMKRKAVPPIKSKFQFSFDGSSIFFIEQSDEVVAVYKITLMEN